MRLLSTKIFVLITFSLFIFSCKSECDHSEQSSLEQNSKRPSQAITYQEMASMFKEYDNGQRLVLNDYISKKSNGKDTIATISQFYSLSELKQYISYIERLSEEKEIELTGVRIFTSAYPSDYKIKEYQNRVSFILAPTTNIGVRKNIAYEPLKSGVKQPVSMKSILDKYADETTRNVNRASVFNFNLMAGDNSSALNRGKTNPPY